MALFFTLKISTFVKIDKSPKHFCMVLRYRSIAYKFKIVILLFIVLLQGHKQLHRLISVKKSDIDNNEVANQCEL